MTAHGENWRLRIEPRVSKNDYVGFLTYDNGEKEAFTGPTSSHVLLTATNFVGVRQHE